MKPLKKNRQMNHEQDPQIHIVETQQLPKTAYSGGETLSLLKTLNDKLDQLLNLIKNRNLNK